MEVAALGFRADSRELKQANDELRKMPAAAGSAERAAKDWGNSTTKAGAAARAANDNAARSATNMARAYDLAKGKIIAFGAAALAAFSTRPIFEFQDALAEVSTLVDTATFDMERLAQSAIEQSAAFGGSAAGQAKALYQIISAGASDAAEATDILTAANKLAVGGVTTVATAADGLTSVMNAYGDQVEGAASVSDAMFVAMRAGKTTIGELASSLGKVAPLAAQTGVGFDELTGSIAALTKGGISTQEAVTGVRAILAAVAKPTAEATKMAKQLGLEFSASGLQAQGFAGFLDQLVQKSGGSTEVLAQLFGGVEALVPVMALSGQAGNDFTAILEQMADKAGATQDAFDKMANSPGFQAGRIWSAITAEILKAGGALGTVLTPVLKAVADNMGTVASLAKVAGAAMLFAFGPAIMSVLATGFGTFVGAVIFGIKAITTAMMANPIGFLLVAITSAIVAAYEFRDKISEVFGVDVVGVFKTVGNFIINSFRAAYADIQFIWDQFPTMIEAAAYGAANGFVAGIEWMVNRALDGFNKIIAGANAVVNFFGGNSAFVRDTLGWNLTIPEFDEVSLGRFDNPAADDFSKANAEHAARIKGIMGSDPLGGLFGSDGAAQSSAEDATTEVQKLIDQLNKVVPSANAAGSASEKAAEKARESYSDLVRGAQEFIEQQKLEASTLGMTEEAANALRYEQELLNKAANDNIKLTAGQKAELTGLAQTMAETEAETSKLKSAYDFAKSTVSGFFDDFRSGLEQGKGIWKSFGDAALGVLGRIGDKLIELATDSLINGLFSNLGGLGGGGGGGIIGGIMGWLFNAKGNAFSQGNVIPFANGGVVSSATMFPMSGGRSGVMGEAGPEAIMPLKRGPDGRLGVSAPKGASAPSQNTYAPTYNIDASNSANPEETRRQVTQALKEYDKGNYQRWLAAQAQARKRNAA